MRLGPVPKQMIMEPEGILASRIIAKARFQAGPLPKGYETTVTCVAGAGGAFVFGALDLSAERAFLLARAGRRLVALTGNLMGGYADDLFNVLFRMEPQNIVAEGFVHCGEGRRDF